MNTEALISIIEKTDSYKRFGKVTRVVGLMIESEGRLRILVRFVTYIPVQTMVISF